MEKRSEHIRKKREANLGDDASSLTHYLGNDDYIQRKREPSILDDGNPDLDGHEAHGNDVDEEDLEDT